MSDPTLTSVQTTPVPASNPLPVAVIGCGRMGRFHARTYAQMPQVRLVGVYDADPQRAADVAGAFNVLPFTHPDELLDHVSAVTVAVPTQFHAAVAEPFLKRGIACLIEKPLAKDAAEGRLIVDWARESGALVQVGHIERFNPVVRAMDRLNIRPTFIDVTRASPLTFRSIDVGVVLDMMIHDIDIVLKLAGSKVVRCDATGVSAIGGVEDFANARLTFENGCVANLTASRLSFNTTRKLRAFSHDAYVAIDYQKKQGVVFHRGPNLEAIRETVAKVRAGQITDMAQVNFRDLVQQEALEINEEDPLRAQLESFVNAVRNNTRPEVTADDGLAAVETAGRIVEAIAAGAK